ncbi:GGDEF domain-containing protein [Rhodoferax lacus]|nr:GGDEF domain-containing protein [Rhodoferax lacus]
MNTLEIVVWAVMLGGLLTIGTMAVVDVVVSKSFTAWRNLVFMGVTGFSCVLLSGLPEDLFPGLPLVPVLILKASLGPLSGAMVLTYLGQWLGVSVEDRLVHHTIVLGSVMLVCAAVGITVLCTLFADTQSDEILLLAASVNALSVLLATLTAARAAQLGDKLARTMVVGCLFLAISMAGLYTHQLDHGNGNLSTWIVTSMATVLFYLVMVSLGISRNREIRRLEHLAGLSQGMDPATGLPRGSLLLSKVDDAFWRSARLNTTCTVICLHLRNLYALSEEAGHGVEQQILASMAARIRRAVGFRCVVGLYHPRCFVVVLSAAKANKSGMSLGERLCILMSQPLQVLGQQEGMHIFTPQFSSGTVTVTAASAIPVQVIDEAEQQALASEREQRGGPDTANSPPAMR